MNAWVIAARRTPVVPRYGPFARLEAAELAGPVFRTVCADAGVATVDQVILGNALYGGGNPARVAALQAGLPEQVPAMTIDTQCCGGLDAVLLAGTLVEAGQAEAVLAGGVESYSRAPLRAHRPRAPGELPHPYERPPFTPWPDRDPDMLAAAAALAAARGISRAAQEAYAIGSHRRALAACLPELVPLAGVVRDTFARKLTPLLCARLQVLAGDAAHGLTAATVAVEADAAAAVLVVGKVLARRFPGRAVRLLGGVRGAGDPACPALAPVVAAQALLARHGIVPAQVAVIEMMEAFAVQAMACLDDIGLDPARANPDGGALARGHPVGASGAILAVRLVHALRDAPEGACGLAAIAAAGGLGSALLLAV